MPPITAHTVFLYPTLDSLTDYQATLSHLHTITKFKMEDGTNLGSSVGR